jgi:hypothetical protein
MPLTRATTGSDADPLDDELDEEEDDDGCCPQPIRIGSTMSATAATVETAVRRGRPS